MHKDINFNYLQIFLKLIALFEGKILLIAI